MRATYTLWVRYDVRPLIAQQHGRHGAYDVLAEINDANAFQNAWHVPSTQTIGPGFGM